MQRIRRALAATWFSSRLSVVTDSTCNWSFQNELPTGPSSRSGCSSRLLGILFRALQHHYRCRRYR